MIRTIKLSRDKSFILFVILIFSAFQEIHGQHLIPKKCYMHLTGSVNKEFPLEVELIKNFDTIFGECTFLGNPAKLEKLYIDVKPMTISGKAGKDSRLTMATDPWERPISFTLQFKEGQTLKGSCDIKGIGKNLPVVLTEKYPEGSIQMNAYFFKGSVALVKNPDSPTGRIRLSLVLPGESSNSIVSDSLKRLIVSRYTENDTRIFDPDKILNSVAQVFFDTYVNNNIDIYNRTSGQCFSWELLNFMHIVQNSSSILAFYTEQYAFTGGAHGLQNRKYTVVSLTTGKVVLLKDLFRENYSEKLTEILTRKARKTYHVPDNKTMIDAGFFVDQIVPTDNFYLTRNGIGFFYNQYDIAPYANGAADLFLPYDELKDILTGDGLLKEFLH